MVTLTTVGYGDIYPITAPGRLLGAWVAILGVGVFALPTGILGSAFVEEIKVYRQKALGKECCPTCRRPLDVPAAEGLGKPPVRTREPSPRSSAAIQPPEKD